MDDQKKELAKAKVLKIQQYLEVFDNDDGKAIVLDLMEKGYILKPTTGKTERESILNEGKREMVLYIMDMLTYDVDDIMGFINNNSAKDTNKGKTHENNESLFNFFGDEEGN